jgi:endo-1,3(4)-beta-glucanase
MQRMTVLLAVLGLVVAGCVGTISGPFLGGDDDGAGADAGPGAGGDGDGGVVDPGDPLDLFGEPLAKDAVAWPGVTHALAPTALWGDVAGPRPTNAWWENLVLGQGGSPVMTLPYLVKALPDRLSVCAPKLVATADFVLSSFEDNLSIGASEPLGAHALTGYDALSATVRWTGAGGSLSAPLVRGMAYASVDYAGLTPRLTTIHAIVSVNGGTGSPAAGKRFEIRLNNGQRWLVYTSANVTFVRDGDRLVASAPFTGTLSAAIVPDDAAVAILDAHASAVLRAGDIAATAQGDEGRLVFAWKSDAGVPLVYSMPHHRDVLAAPELTALRTTSIRGALVAVAGATWTMVEPLPTITWGAPRPIAPDRRADLAAALVEDARTLRPRAGDPYFFGKQIAALCRLALIGDELGDTASAQAARAAATEAIAPWLAAGGGKLSYDRTWGGVLATGAEKDPGAAFGQGFYNDHHFHYGYFLYAAAVLAKADPAWGRANDAALRGLARDIAEPSGKDAEFARFRTMDWYEGHSWAAGLFEFADSRNQESTAEAVNAWYGLSLYGLATGDRRMRDLGRLMLATELRGAHTYWQIKSDQADAIYPAAYAGRHVVGVLWGTKVDHATFFGSNLEFIHVIQMMPFTPITELLVPRDWLADSYALLATTLTRPDPPIEATWRGLVYAAHAVLDADAAWEESKDLTVFDDGSSRTNQLYWIATRP